LLQPVYLRSSAWLHTRVMLLLRVRALSYRTLGACLQHCVSLTLLQNLDTWGDNVSRQGSILDHLVFHIGLEIERKHLSET
jgi:hypothetical protein